MGRCMFFTVLLCLVLSLSEGTTPTTTGSSTTTTTVLATEGSSSATTVQTSTASETSPTSTTPTTTGSSTTTTTVLATEGSSSATTEQTSTASETSPTGTTPTTTGSSTTTTTVLATEGSSSATTEQTSTASETSPTGTTPTTTESSTTNATVVATGESSSATTEQTSTASETSATGTTPTTTESSTTNATVVATGESSSATTEQTSTASETSATGTTPTTTESSTTNATVVATGESSSTTTEQTSTASETSATGELCGSSPCGGKLSTCVPLNNTYICQCSYGFYYYSNDCYLGKVFPGTVTLTQVFGNDIHDVNSMEYQNMVQNIIQFFQIAFENMTDYRQTIIVKFNYIEDANTRSAKNPVNVTVMNIFREGTTETDADVEKAVMAAAGNLSYVNGYSTATACAVYPCDNTTTTCEDGEYPACVCKPNFTKTAWDTYSCSGCVNCTEEENMFCDRQNGVPDCKCMDNFKKEGEKCVRCPVGYSGKDCQNNKELILIIVGTVFGVIILCLVAAVSILSVRAKHSHDPEKKRLIKPRNSNSNISEETRIFPRVQTTSGHVNPGYQPNNPYEVDSSNRGVFVEKNYDDLYEISRRPEDFQMQRR
ncbi:mucin-13 isoform X12 [Lagopus muta]|uniref:mucin-13 isoform X7 n=1 Tax=Lagopus muta TaxID=64668 RepID=UPI0020A18F62|nr:mucin-13 isoform X7 [Lagopus muta]XP_048809618.1 mucin-13 isoform X8 [Lagopus muta]XP_048809619.1 mucin-13 isoform X9 [Lagopus muta]XP_048809620.1 mucin-13 isoform X10 [Lagopus muta]XP_048809621.1 mucin-13 isoform X11 [Lagopus muta]XP_048809622.1 mucin-13 isoform X12 [Lagopus muta]